MALLISLLLLSSISSLVDASPVKPGARVRFTRHGLQYMAEVGTKTLQRELKNMKFDNISGERGSLGYQLVDTKVIDTWFPDVRLLPQPNVGLTAILLNASISVTGQLHFTLKSYIEISDKVCMARNQHDARLFEWEGWRANLSGTRRRGL